MRIAVFSDLHGNAAALSAVLAELEARAPDRVFVLGDLAGRGPRPRKVIDVVSAHGFERTRGRWDAWFGGDSGGARPEHALRSAERALRRSDFAFLASAPDALRERIEGRSVLLTHGGAPYLEPLVSRWTPPAELEEIFERREADIIVFGHSDPAFVRTVGAKLLINTGSAGYPVTGDPRPSLVLLDLIRGQAPRAEIVRVPYTLAKTRRHVEKDVRRGRMPADVAHDYLRALLGPYDGQEVALHRTLAGCDLAVALLARRVATAYAKAADPWPLDDVEHVHQLRVATRRLREALALAAPLLPRRAVKRADRRARRLGRTLGARRVLDVLVQDVQRAQSEMGLDLEGFIAFLDGRREEATRGVHACFPREKLVRHGLVLLDLSMEARPALALHVLASPHLEALAQRVDERLPGMDEEEATEAHHRLRIALKHLRYALEILGPAYADIIDPEATVAPLKVLQDLLGELNDRRELIALAREHGDGRALETFVERLEAGTRAHFEAARAQVAKDVPGILAESHAIAARILRG